MLFSRPKLSITSKTQDPYVQVLIGDQRFERRDVELGISDGINVEVISGLEKEDQIKVWNKTEAKDNPTDDE